MFCVVNSHTNANRIGRHLWEADLKSSPGLPSGWLGPDTSHHARVHALDGHVRGHAAR